VNCRSLLHADQLLVLASVHEGISLAGDHLLDADTSLHLHVSVWWHQRDLAQHHRTIHTTVSTI